MSWRPATCDTICAPVPERSHDEIAVTTVLPDGGARIELWNPVTHLKLASTRSSSRVIQILSLKNVLVCASRHDLLVGPSDLSNPPHTTWHTNREILRITPYLSGWMTLVGDSAAAEHPTGGQVYWFKNNGSTKPLLLSLRSIYNFWDIQEGDIDGDGSPVIALCTWSKTRIVHEYARRYFIYGMTTTDSYPRWRGSRLSKPYLEARLVKPAKGREWQLLSVESAGPAQVCLMLYTWDDFGFYGLGRSRLLAGASLVRNDIGVPLARIRTPGGDQLVQPVLNKEIVELRSVCRLQKDDSVVVGRFGGMQVSALVIPTGRVEKCRIIKLPVSIN